MRGRGILGVRRYFGRKNMFWEVANIFLRKGYVLEERFASWLVGRRFFGREVCLGKEVY